jgi:CRISPR-associated endonuclease/helicase Cas3
VLVVFLVIFLWRILILKDLMREIELYDISERLINQDILYAHIDDSKAKVERKAPETILEHSQRTVHFFSRLVDEKGIGEIIINIIESLKIKGSIIDEETKKLISEMFVNAVFMHDLGKINPAFQVKKMKNTAVKLKYSPEAGDSSHSIFSSLIYIHTYIDRIQILKGTFKKHYLKQVLYRFAYIISRHHTYLDDLGEVDFLEDLKQAYKKIENEPSYLTYYKDAESFRNTLNLNTFCNVDKVKDDCTFEFYVLCKLLYSIIVSCDFYATSLYDTGKEADFGYMKDTSSFLREYQNSTIYKGIREYQKDSTYFGENSINSLRSEMFLEAEKNLLENMDSCNIFYLEAPTGSGKTNTSINLALNIIERVEQINKVVYVFPFNTLVDQTKKALDNMFSEESQRNNRIAVVNSITPVITEKEKDNDAEDYIDYKKDYLNRQLLQYPIVLTTHINFFNYLFGIGREINLPLIHLCNSVVIMDEIQSYRNKIWPEIIESLNALSKLLNIKIIIMSATLPKLDELIRMDKIQFCDLIKNREKYYQNKLFKQRVALNFDLLNGPEKTTEEELLSKFDEVIRINKDKRILIEFISKVTSRSFYNKIKSAYPKRKVYEITGDDSTFIRGKILKEINETDDSGQFINKNIIIVATQVIEAGVDIDMDIGFKDISLLDGEEQFLGRINRSCKREGCKAYFFDLDKAERIYREDWRLEKDLSDVKYQRYLEDKNFLEFYELCFDRLRQKKSENNENNIKNLDEAVHQLNFKRVSDMLRLILEENYQVYLPYKIKDEATGVVIDGRAVWHSYKELLEDKEMDYSEKKIKLSRVAEKMAYFTFNYVDRSSKSDRTPKMFDEVIGRIYYIDNGKRYITEENKFNRMLFQEESGGKFI